MCTLSNLYTSVHRFFAVTGLAMHHILGATILHGRRRNLATCTSCHNEATRIHAFLQILINLKVCLVNVSVCELTRVVAVDVTTVEASSVNGIV